jgi:poly-D-alanine transfer protein DltD
VILFIPVTQEIKHFIMKIYWEKKKDKIRQKFSGITNKDLTYRVGREYEMLKKLRDKLGKTEEEMLNIIIEL